MLTHVESYALLNSFNELSSLNVSLSITSKGQDYLVCSQDGFGPSCSRTLPAYTYRTPDVHLIELSQGIVWGRHLVILSPENKVAIPGGYSFSRNWAVSLTERHSNQRTELEHKSGRALILGICSHYGHMFVDCIDRNYSKEELSTYDYYVVDELRNFSDWYILNKLRIPRQKIIELKGSALQFDSLSCGTNYSLKPNWSKFTLGYLRTWAPSTSPLKGGKIFITRKGAAKRNFVDLSTVVNSMQNVGFQPIDTAEFSFEQQISIFSSSQWVVGPIGTDLFNIVFCRPGTRVICLVQRTYFEKMGDNVQMVRSLAASSALHLSFFLCGGLEGSYDSSLNPDCNALISLIDLLGD